MNMHRLHYIQHVPFEGLGSISAWADRHRVTVSCPRLFLGEELPSTEAYDILVVMGGPMGVHDTAAHPWLTAEMSHLESAIKARKKVVGICLGAQLLAHVMGAEVTTNPHREIGWFRVERTAAAATSGIHTAFAPAADAFHWHGQTFGIPSGAVHLATSEACTNQAFIYEDRILGLQYHLETTPAAAQSLVDHCGDEMTPAPYVQSAETIMASLDRFSTINSHMAKLLDYLAS